MIFVIHSSGYVGPVGLLDHQRTTDSMIVLRKNLVGLRRILIDIGDRAGASTY